LFSDRCIQDLRIRAQSYPTFTSAPSGTSFPLGSSLYTLSLSTSWWIPSSSKWPKVSLLPSSKKQSHSVCPFLLTVAASVDCCGHLLWEFRLMRLMLGDNTPGVGGFLFVQPSPASGIQLCDCRSTNWICQPVWELCWWWQWLKVPELAANGGSSDQSKDHPGCPRWQEYYYHCGLGHFPVC
jgi:hypothetical protein